MNRGKVSLISSTISYYVVKKISCCEAGFDCDYVVKDRRGSYEKWHRTCTESTWHKRRGYDYRNETENKRTYPYLTFFEPN
ncbi:MAG: hypothetical protein WA364_23590 [Candidatus Nitrosopolaris sp.]